MRSNAQRLAIRQQIKKNKHEVYVVSLEEMDKIITKGVKGNIIKEQWKVFRNKLDVSANYFASGKDTVLLGKLMGDLGFAGTRAYIKFYKGKAHIILKGHPGLRTIFTGTRYGVQNAKVVHMGLGKYGAVNAAKGGGVLTIILLSAYRIIDYFLTDTTTLNQLIGTLATDVVKVGIATGASVAASTVIAGIGVSMSAGAATGIAAGLVVAIGPLVAIIVVGILVSLALSYVDEQYHLTDKVIAALDEIEEKGILGIIEEKKQALIHKGNTLANDAVDSAIDYAMESAKQILINVLNNAYQKLVAPGVR